jgi:hypothetical protein
MSTPAVIKSGSMTLANATFLEVSSCEYIGLCPVKTTHGVALRSIERSVWVSHPNCSDLTAGE